MEKDRHGESNQSGALENQQQGNPELKHIGSPDRSVKCPGIRGNEIAEVGRNLRMQHRGAGNRRIKVVPVQLLGPGPEIHKHHRRPNHWGKA